MHDRATPARPGRFFQENVEHAPLTRKKCIANPGILVVNSVLLRLTAPNHSVGRRPRCITAEELPAAFPSDPLDHPGG